jgi:hypothetical protein
VPRLVYLAGVALLLVAGAFLLTDAMLPPAPGVTERNVRRIKNGMSLARVKEILGEKRMLLVYDPLGRWEAKVMLGIWRGEGGSAWIQFDRFEQVHGSYFDATAPNRRHLSLKVLSPGVPGESSGR